MLSAWTWRCRSPWTPALRRAYTTERSSSVIYDDKALLVLNKPAGFHSQLKGGKPNVLDLLQDYTSRGTGVWACHRLDKITTGALICAKTAATAKELNQQFRQHAVEKVYLALVLSTRMVHRAGTILEPLMQKNGNVSLWKEGAVQEKIDAVTEYDVLAQSPIAPVSLLRFKPKTGRKHQIRVHSASVLESPILGDNRHMKPADTQSAGALELLADTLFLHSAFISCYRYSRGKPRFRLGVMAPLQHPFVDLCNQLQILVPQEYTQGGVYIDGERVEDGVVEDVEGRWLL